MDVSAGCSCVLVSGQTVVEPQRQPLTAYGKPTSWQSGSESAGYPKNLHPSAKTGLPPRNRKKEKKDRHLPCIYFWMNGRDPAMRVTQNLQKKKWVLAQEQLKGSQTAWLQLSLIAGKLGVIKE